MHHAQHSVGEKVSLTSANALCVNFSEPLNDSGSRFIHLQSETIGQDGHQDALQLKKIISKVI